MGIVIAWPGPSHSTARARPAEASRAKSGEIILFLGVRYERHAERAEPAGTAESNPAGQTPGRKGNATRNPARERRRRRG